MVSLLVALAAAPSSARAGQLSLGVADIPDAMQDRLLGRYVPALAYRQGLSTNLGLELRASYAPNRGLESIGSLPVVLLAIASREDMDPLVQPVDVETLRAELIVDLAPARDPTTLQLIPHARLGAGVLLGHRVDLTYQGDGETLAAETAGRWLAVPILAELAFEARPPGRFGLRFDVGLIAEVRNLIPAGAGGIPDERELRFQPRTGLDLVVDLGGGG